MYRKRRAGVRRFAVAAIVALLATVGLLFLMTRLILPREYHPIDARVFQKVDFERASQPLEEIDFPAFEIPQAIVKKWSLPPVDPSARILHQIETKEIRTGGRLENRGRPRKFDWQREKRRLAQASDDAAFNRWLLEQGHERYGSIMQGPLPITNSVRAKLPPTQEDITGYMNIFGDKEYKIGENCVATTQVAARLDQSDFAKALPMIITCKPRRQKKHLFDRRGRE